MLSSAKITSTCSVLKKFMFETGFKFLVNLAAIEKLEGILKAGRLKRIITAWHIVAKDSKRTKEYFKVRFYL